jgi:hypothetical protein
MSLRGTLGDFGIADIFQLIGHQAKTGILLLKDREVEVRITFVEGNVVKAERSSRDKADLLGNIMVRAGALSEEQLAEALAAQQRTLRRLGDILVDSGVVDRATLKDFARLQTTETIYRLFQWRAGTYEFTAQKVEYDEASYDPIRSENILMEGFRLVDEWPSVRRVIPTSGVSFRVLKPLPPPGDDDDDDDLDFDAAFDEGGVAAPPPRRIGENERRVFPLVVPGRTVAGIVDVSRLGEFETSKALATLVTHGVLEVIAPAQTGPSSFAVARAAVVAEAGPFAVRVAVFVVVAALVGLLVRGASRLEGGLLARAHRVARPAAVTERLGAIGLRRLHAALAVARLERGHPPERLEELVDEGLLQPRDLTFPFAAPYAYRLITADPGYELALPLR